MQEHSKGVQLLLLTLYVYMEALTLNLLAPTTVGARINP